MNVQPHNGGGISTGCLWNFGLTVRVPLTGSSIPPLKDACTCSPLGNHLLFCLLEGSLKEGRVPS